MLARAGDGLVELGEAGHPAEDPVEPGAQGGPPGRRRLVLVELQVGVEPPHQLTLQVDQPLLLGGDADQPPEVTLGMDPAQGVGEDVELAGVVGDDDGVGQQAARDDRADQGGLGDQPPVTGAEAEAARCACQAASSAKLRRSWASRAATMLRARRARACRPPPRR